MCTNSIKLYKILGILILLVITSMNVQSQVTIGSGTAPEKGALLQLKDQEDSPEGVTATSGGLLLPRVTLTDKYMLYPMFLSDPQNPASGSNDEYDENKDALDKAHTGLVVYNLLENEGIGLCLGLNFWDGEQWSCLSSGADYAVFEPVDCSMIVMHGEYVEGTTVGTGNYMEVTLQVRETGIFTVSAVSNNGYDFYLTGVALHTGELIINIPCIGTPALRGVNQLFFEGINLAEGCNPEVMVSSSASVYALNCSNITVNGQYVKGESLTSENTITLSMTVSTPGSYSIDVPEEQGISFHTSGEFNESGTFTVTLSGTGTPTVNTDFSVTIRASTPTGNNTCSAVIPVTLPSMTYAIIGSTSVYAWNSPTRLLALGNESNFGPNGAVRILGFSQLWVTNDVTTAQGYLDNGFNGGQQPDVVLYFAYQAAPNAALTSALNNYINRGGCVIYGSADSSAADVNTLMNGLFGTNPAIAQTVSGGVTADEVYPVSYLPDSPVVNGPFGNLLGRHWGEDNFSTGSVIMTVLPPNSVQVCSARSASKINQNPEYSIVWYNESKNFLYFGDSTGSSTTDSSSNGYPSYYDAQGLPRSKSYGSGAFIQFVYNSALELNAVAWAIRKAASSGINPY